jgi:hypothetical protein
MATRGGFSVAEFKSYQSYQRFAESVTTQLRYERTVEHSEFLQTVLATSTSRTDNEKAGGVLWRAQLHDLNTETQEGWDEDGNPSPYSPSRMKPRPHRAREGRANPKGISYFYAATHEKTAIAEVRPWIGSYVSVAQFKLTRAIRVVDCVSKGRDQNIIYGESEPEPAEREREVWKDIDRAFSRPVTPGEDTADYAPTQVLAEFFRQNGLDGVGYGSSLGPGHNVVLFDVEAVRLHGCELVRVNTVDFDVSLESGPYTMRDQKD